MSQRPHTYRAFTLIEMLLVVSLIALLISLLLPTLTKARLNARIAVCIANAHALSGAALTYSADWHGKMFPYDNADNTLRYETFWMTLIDKYTGDMDSLRMCPETTSSPAAQAGAYAPGWGTKVGAWGMPWLTNGWGFLGRNYGSYGWNSWMHSGRTAFIKGQTTDVNDDRRHWKSVKRCNKAATTPFFSDMNWVDTWFHNRPGLVSQPPTNLFAENSGAGRVCMDRHGRGTCHGYVDGSAGWVTLEGLWRLTWNTESVPMNPPWALPAQ